MPISPSLRAAARAAYRELFRAASTAFHGDDRVLNAFRLKIRTDALEAASVTDSNVYVEKAKLAREMAKILRENVVQGEKVEGDATWRLRLTKDTELGSNESIKTPVPMPTKQLIRKRKQDQFVSGVADATHETSTPAIPRNYSALKRAHRERKIPELHENDLEEKFVRGGGPGGQSVNKTKNRVQLLHKPTGISVTCHVTRSLATNRMLARRKLLDTLDKISNLGLSNTDLKVAKERERERRRRKKAKNRAKGRNRADL